MRAEVDPRAILKAAVREPRVAYVSLTDRLTLAFSLLAPQLTDWMLGRAFDLQHSLVAALLLAHLVLFRRLPHLDEVSIGHALVSYALFVGLSQSVHEYLDVLGV